MTMLIRIPFKKRSHNKNLYIIENHISPTVNCFDFYNIVYIIKMRKKEEKSMVIIRSVKYILFYIKLYQ